MIDALIVFAALWGVGGLSFWAYRTVELLRSKGVGTLFTYSLPLFFVSVLMGPIAWWVYANSEPH